MAQRDDPNQDSILHNVENPQALTKEELWQLAKQQKRRVQAASAQAAPDVQPTEPQTESKDQLWSQAKKRKVTIRRLNVPTSAQPTSPAEAIDEQQFQAGDDFQTPDNEVLQAEDRVESTASEPALEISSEPRTADSVSGEEIELPPGDDSDRPEPNKDDPADSEKDEPVGEREVIRLGDVNPDGEKTKTPKEKWRDFWLAIGGQSLALSLGLHLVLLAVAGFIVFSTVTEQRIDFLSGGGTEQGNKASQELESAIKRKRMPWTQKTPMQKLAVQSSSSALTLPDNMMDLPMPDLSSIMDGSMGGLGMGKMGAGGGFGNGIGAGGKSGVSFQPLMMFGKKLGGKKLAVVLDVSGSMLADLPKVVSEADRVANGSIIVCFSGCGLSARKGNDRLPERAQSTASGGFKKFWEELNGPRNRDGQDPVWAVYDILQRRRNTFFIDVNDIRYAWLALIADEVRTADTLYWFSDFLDEVEDRQMKLVLENLKRRKQRLYVQHIRSWEGIAVEDLGATFDVIRKGLVEPSGGEVVEPLVAK